ncbi:MAG: Foldase protein PrsA precursor [Firmicutes bacterium ADurb.Bin193]|nr:MAG: Foldase protein PrsA precursor [Firmicutes bacterium ADurb.Bin193]
MKRVGKLALSVVIIVMVASLVSCVSFNKATVATVNGDSITREEFVYYLTSVKAQIESEQGADIPEDFWETAEIDGKKVIETAKEKALEEAVKSKVAYQKAMEEGIKITSEQRKDINSRLGQIITNNNGEKGANEYLKQYGLNLKLLEKQYEINYLSQNLSEKLTGDIDDAAALEYYKNSIARVKHVLIKTVDDQGTPLSVEAIEAAKIKADDILKRAKEGEDFDKLVAEFSEDPGSTSQPEGYYVGKGFALGNPGGGMVKAFETASLELEVGGISDIVETSFGYHIIKRYENAESKYEENKVELLFRAKNARFEELLEGWKNEAKIEKKDKEYNSVK